MIVGIGSDAIEISRIKSACERQGDRFLRRILSEREFAATAEMSGHRRYEYAAGRFAMKEAMAKASGLGLAKLGMSQVDIAVGPRGLEVAFKPGSALADDASRWHLTITHTTDIAFAVAVLEQV